MAWSVEILQRYGEALLGGWWLPVLGGAAFFGLGSLDRRLGPGRRLVLRRALLALAVLVGLALAVRGACLMDDAYISLRYAQNLLDGHGLVWNQGERVEGYTNFLWTLMLAGLGLSGVELPLLALVASLLAWLFMLAGAVLLSRRLMPAGLPLAVVLLALHASSLDYATSGLETAFATGLVLWGLFFLARDGGPRDTALCGVFLILAVFTRPDHALFWLAGGAAVLARDIDRSRPLASLLERRSWLFPASFLPYALYLGWKLSYYGQILPNTFYAKSANEAYFSQGWIYTWSFLLGSGLWLLLPLAFRGLRRLAREQRPVAVFAGLSLLVWHLYVAKVGGDFMYGRFFVVVLPLWLLLAQAGLGRRLGLLALLGASLHGQAIIGPQVHRWHITDEARVYPVRQWLPEVVIDHHNYRTGRRLAVLAQGPETLTIATSGIGMVGYYSGLRVIDLLGLTDKRTARKKVEERGMPGHEKRASFEYVLRQETVLVRWEFAPPDWLRATRVDLGLELNQSNAWRLARYDPELIARLEQLDPTIGVRPMQPVVQAWAADIPQRDPQVLADDLAFLDGYYFAYVDHPGEAALRAYAQGFVDRAAPAD